jgi:microcystin-dependent protein
MSCGCNKNGLTSCGCNDNCPYKTSDITVFDGNFTSIVLPAGAGLNEALEALEEFTINSVNNLNLVFTVNPGNCINLAPGQYGYNQIFDAINNALCDLNTTISNIEGDITSIQGDITSIQGDITSIQGDITNVESSIGDVMPIGSMIMYPIAAEPNSKWQICEGQSLNKNTYADLFDVIGYNFGGFGTTFKLPDMRSKFLVGYDGTGAAEYQTIGQGGGQNDVALTAAEIPKHKHVIGNGTDGSSIDNPGNHDHRGGYTFNSILEGGNVPSEQTWDLEEGGAVGPVFKRVGGFPYADGAHTHSGFTGDGTGAGLSGASHENRPAFIVFPWMIKVLS